MQSSARLVLAALSACALSLAASAAKPSRAASPALDAESGKAAPDAGPSDLRKARAVAERVQRYYGKRKDFQASFQQRYTYAALGRSEEKTGIVQVKRPGLLRWEYAAPEKKLLILDGKSFWQWSPEDNQVVVKRDVHGEQFSAAFTFLWGKGDLLAEFSPRSIALPEGLPKGDAVELDPKIAGGNVQKIVFSVDPKGRVLASVVTDGQGNENRLVFADAKIDQKLPDSLFQFAPPAGANVQELP